MNRPLNFSKDNLPVQWQYVNRNLKEMGLWEKVENNVKNTVKETIEKMVWEEYNAILARKRYKRLQNSVGYRSGSYKRSISTTHGRADNLAMPKSKGIRVKYNCLKAYQRRQPEFDQHILKSLVLGLSTRKQKKFFNSFIGDSVSHTTASRLVNEISYLLNQYRNKPLVDQYKYLYLDAIWVHLKELDIKNRPVLVALGIKKDGSKDILAFKLANSESEKEWLGLINDLYRRGLEGFKLELIISDSCPGLKSAISYVYPYTQLQLCTVHKLRNILGKIKNKKKNRKKLMQQASNVFKSKSKNQAITRYNKFLKDWKDKEPAAVKTMKRDIQYYLTYFNFPQEKRNSLKSTNPLERINREMRKITRRFGYFQSQKSLDIYLYLFLKEEKLIIDEQKEDVPDENKKIASLEFANNS